MRMIYLLFIISLFFISCTKTDNISAKDVSKPIVKIITPVTSEHYNTGEPLCFKGTADDNGLISSMNLRIEKNGAVIPGLDYNFSLMERSVYLDKKIIVSSEINGSCTLVFEATDISGNKGSIRFNFSAN